MNINELQRIQQAAGTTDGVQLPRPRRPDRASGSDFSDTFKQAIERVDEAQKTADSEVEAFIAGENDNLHDVMIAMNQAKLHFQLMAEVRNRTIETYQELMRMQV